MTFPLRIDIADRPEFDPDSSAPIPVPYLAGTGPRDVSVGRQLFVDDYLVDSSAAVRTFHKAEKHPGNPILVPETAAELGPDRTPMASPFSGGIIFDPADGLYKLWYHAGWFHAVALAVSTDGINWERRPYDVVPGTNLVLPPRRNLAGEKDLWRDSVAVFRDPGDNPSRRFKLYHSSRTEDYEARGLVMTSPDGIHWTEVGGTGQVGDRSTMFYDPFRQEWVFSVRAYSRQGRKRVRRHVVRKTLTDGNTVWNDAEAPYWLRADERDLPDAAIGDRPQLYNFDAAPYESLMLGAFTIHRGPPNDVCARKGEPKITEIELGFSRDGYHFDRPFREPFIAATRRPGDWERGFLHSTANLCVVAGDRLHFYYTGCRGEPDNLNPNQNLNGMYGWCSTGLATLRRDGFASLDAQAGGAEVVTRPLVNFGRHLFVNVDAAGGELRAEVIGPDGRPLAGFELGSCRPITTDATRAAIAWAGEPALPEGIGGPIRLRFAYRSARLFSFWLSPSAAGESLGFVGGGGPGFTDGRDGEVR